MNLCTCAQASASTVCWWLSDLGQALQCSLNSNADPSHVVCSEHFKCPCSGRQARGHWRKQEHRLSRVGGAAPPRHPDTRLSALPHDAGCDGRDPHSPSAGYGRRTRCQGPGRPEVRSTDLAEHMCGSATSSTAPMLQLAPQAYTHKHCGSTGSKSTLPHLQS